MKYFCKSCQFLTIHVIIHYYYDHMDHFHAELNQVRNLMFLRPVISVL
jgi:hypothetical protein